MSKASGRGMWVSANARLEQTAAAKVLFSRRAGGTVKADAGLATRTEARLVETGFSILSDLAAAPGSHLRFRSVEKALRGPGAPRRDHRSLRAAADGSRNSRPLRGKRNRPFVIGGT